MMFSSFIRIYYQVTLKRATGGGGGSLSSRRGARRSPIDLDASCIYYLGTTVRLIVRFRDYTSCALRCTRFNTLLALCAIYYTYSARMRCLTLYTFLVRGCASHVDVVVFEL